MAHTRIACAGWTIGREVACAFGAPGSHLERYSQVLNAVEINSSFYRPHRAQTYARWAASVPDGFRFSVKLPRAITHEGRLRDIDPALAQFAQEVGMLGPKLGCILVQLPPKLEFDPALAAAFFTRMRATFDCMIACEARHPSWFDAPASALLRTHAITRVIADPPKGQAGAHVPTTAAIYCRLHGSPRVYYSAYSPDYLAQLQRDIEVHAAHGRSVWIVFDNTASGAALSNALALVQLAGASSKTRECAEQTSAIERDESWVNPVRG